MWTIIIASLVVFGIAALVMAVGVIFKGRCLRGSCGGPGILDSAGEDIRCATCPHRDENKCDEAIAVK